VFGVIPAWQAANLDLTDTLKDIGRHAQEGRRSSLTRHALVAVQVSLSMILLLGAALLLNSLIRLLGVDPGFKTANLLCTVVRLPPTASGTTESPHDMLRQVSERVRTLPGIQQAALVSSLPLGDSPTGGQVVAEGDAPSQSGGQINASSAVVSPEYFPLMSLGLLRGRYLNDRDARAASPAVVVNERMARMLWPEGDALGRRIVVGQGTSRRGFEVAGVVADARQVLTLRPMPQYYQSYLQSRLGAMYVLVRATHSTPNLARELREAIQSCDRRLVVGPVRTMEQATDRYYVRPRFYAVLFGTLSAVALLIALVGIYGVMTYTVAQRTHEIGVRMAFGAQARHILRLVLGQGMLTTSIGVMVGIGGGLVLTRLLLNLVELYGVRPTDPGTFAGIAALFVLVALPGCYLPARRAMKIEPVAAIRFE
jgi:putative ABC transport system permease protein